MALNKVEKRMLEYTERLLKTKYPNDYKIIKQIEKCDEIINEYNERLDNYVKQSRNKK